MQHDTRHSFLVGLIGAGISASRTPRMHEREADALGLRYIYRLIDLDELKLDVSALPELLLAAERMGFAGLNITHPCKQSVIALLDELSDHAHSIGAVNTVVFEKGRRIGHNTDWWGFAESFRHGLPRASLKRVVLLGAGGAGAAVGYAALALGAEELIIFDTNRGRAEHLAERLCQHAGPNRANAAANLSDALAGADGVIHATPTGMAAYPGLPLPRELLGPNLWVAEIVYFPLETELLRAATSAGCRTLDGSGMAIFQAVEAFRLFTGITPDAERMRRHFKTH